jgi:hypothetical protein
VGTPWDSATKHGTRLSTAMSRVVDSHSHESVHSHMSRVMSPSEVRPTNLQRAQSRATERGRRSSSREASSVEGSELSRGLSRATGRGRRSSSRARAQLGQMSKPTTECPRALRQSTRQTRPRTAGANSYRSPSRSMPPLPPQRRKRVPKGIQGALPTCQQRPCKARDCCSSRRLPHYKPRAKMQMELAQAAAPCVARLLLA